MMHTVTPRLLPDARAGLGYRRAFADELLSLDPQQSPIAFLEVAPENWARMGGAALRQFDEAAERFPVACHGLSLSLGGRDPLNTALLADTKRLMRRYGMTFFSEHLSYCGHEGQLYDLLPLPFTAEMVRHTAARIRQVQDFLGMQIAVENTSYYVHSDLAEMDEVAFLNAVAAEADCAIHLDINNIYVNQTNHGLLDARTFLDRVDGKRVCYLHIAGHEAESENLLIDTHGETVHEPVWDLLAYAYRVLPQVPPTLLERDFNFPPFADLLAEVARIDALQQPYRSEYAAA